MTASDGPGEHFSWHYTEFGVVCACGASMRGDETCPDDDKAHATSPVGEG